MAIRYRDKDSKTEDSSQTCGREICEVYALPEAG